jgi:plastocyanin
LTASYLPATLTSQVELSKALKQTTYLGNHFEASLPTTMILSKTSRTPWFMLALAAVQFTASMAQEATYRDPSAITTAQVPSSSSSSSPSPTTFQSSTSTGSFEPQTHTIQVGLADHKMRPETTEAAIGDIVEFDFYPLNHSVVRAEYGFPCIPYEMAGSDKTGFFSGFNSVDRVLDNPPKYSVRINDTEPIFFYCSAPGSCITYGMVGGINLNSSMSIDKQRTLAMDSAYMLQPGEYLLLVFRPNLDIDKAQANPSPANRPYRPTTQHSPQHPHLTPYLPLHLHPQ